MTPEEVMALYEKYINPSATRLFRFMGLASVEAQAEGWTIKDTEGTEFIDCLGGYGMFALGHKNPKVVEAVERELHAMPMCGKVLFNEPARGWQKNWRPSRRGNYNIIFSATAAPKL